MTEQVKPWAGFGYEPVPHLTNRLIARYLRTQRKNMRRFFQERGLYTFADRMDQIRKSRQGMLAKNRYFQEVLNEYSALANPTTTPISTRVTADVGGVQESAPVIAGESEAADQ
jgi:hypothetical protein